MADETKRKVVVVVGPRPNGRVWAAGKPWAQGRTEAEVAEEELFILADRTDLAVFENGRKLKVEHGKTSVLNLTPDEVAVLVEYRQNLTKDPSLSAKYGERSAPRLVATDERDHGAAAPARPPSPAPAFVPPEPRAVLPSATTHESAAKRRR